MMNGASQPSFILQRNRLLSRRLRTVPLIEFPSAGVTDVAQSPYLRRLIRSGRVVGSFVTVQIIVQLVGFLSGILLIRMLEQRQYAFFTIANTMQGTLNLLADVGIIVGLVSIGGKVWQNPPRFSQLISTARHLRRRLALVAAIAITPLLYFMLAKNGAPPNYTALLTILVLIGLAIQLDVVVLGVIPRLRADIGVIQRIGLIGAILRLTILVLLAFIFLNAGRNRPQDNSDLQRKIPVLQVLKIARDSILNVGIISRFAAKTAHLSQPGNSRLNERADMVARHYFRKFGVMLEQMRARTDDAHFAAQHIPKLRNFIDAELPEKSPEWINAVVAPARLVRDLFVAGTHRAKFVNGESAILNSGTHLLMQERAGRLQALRDPDNDRHHWKHHGQDEPGNDEINRAFDETIERILQRFFAQGHKTKSAVLEVDHGMTQRFLQIAEDD